MSFTPQFHPFPQSPANPQHERLVLHRPPSPSVNFPNPNTHHFYGPATLYLLTQSKALRPHRSAKPRPFAPVIDCIPASVPLPPTPPPKDSPHPLPTPVSRQGAVPAPSASLPKRSTPPSRRLPLHHGALPSVPFPSPQLPPDVFHTPPTLPRRSAFYPLNPRPQYIPSREAPAPPVGLTPPVGVSSTDPALLRGRPELCERPSRRYRLWSSWTVGIPLGGVICGGVACLGTGIVLVAIKSLSDSDTTDAQTSVNIAAIVLCVVGFFVTCGTTIHFFLLSRGRKSRESQRDMEGAREMESRGGYTLANDLSGFSRSTRKFVSAPGTEATLTDVQAAGSAAVVTEPSLVSANRRRSREIWPNPRDRAAQSLRPNTRLKPLGPSDSSCKCAVSVQTGKPSASGAVLHANGRNDHVSSGMTTFLDLEDEDDDDEESVGGAPASVNRGIEDTAMQISTSSPGEPRAELPRQQQQQCINADLKPMSETLRTKQRARDARLMSYKSLNDSRPVSIEEHTDLDAENDNQMQDLARYTSTYNRLFQNGLLHEQRHGPNDPAQGQAVHLSKLAIRTKADLLEASRPLMKRKPVARTEQFKSKHVEEESAIGQDGNGEGDKATQSTNSHTPSDTDFGELMSLAARSSGFPSVSSLPPLPDLTNVFQSDNSQRPSPYRRSVSDPPILDSCRTTSFSASPTERGPGDLILRMRNAHKRSESSDGLPLVRNPVVGEGSGYMLAPLLPSTTYNPNSSRREACHFAQPLTASSVEALGHASLIGAHTQSMVEHDTAPAIQIREASHRATEHSSVNAPMPQVAEFCTASTSHRLSPNSTSPSPAAVSASRRRRRPTASSQTLASRHRSSLIEPIPYLPPWDDRVQRLERQWGGAVEEDRSTPFQANSTSEDVEDEEELRESVFVDEGDESWGGGRAADV